MCATNMHAIYPFPRKQTPRCRKALYDIYDNIRNNYGLYYLCLHIYRRPTTQKSIRWPEDREQCLHEPHHLHSLHNGTLLLDVILVFGSLAHVHLISTVFHVIAFLYLYSPGLRFLQHARRNLGYQRRQYHANRSWCRCRPWQRFNC